VWWAGDFIKMTIDELANKMDSRFDNLDTKVDSMNTTVALHSQSIASNDVEHKDFKTRLGKVERWMWLTLGAGGAAGVGVAKLFM
jgi:hypothetical protein